MEPMFTRQLTYFFIQLQIFKAYRTSYGRGLLSKFINFQFHLTIESISSKYFENHFARASQNRNKQQHCKYGQDYSNVESCSENEDHIINCTKLTNQSRLRCLALWIEFSFCFLSLERLSIPRSFHKGAN